MSSAPKYKTVIILDNSPYFNKSSQEPIEFDVFIKSRIPGMIPLAPISKSLWTCSVEAAVEYCRVVFDIYPGEDLVSIVVSGTEAKVLNGWSMPEQNLQHLMNVMAQAEIPNVNESHDDLYTIIHGVTAAVEALCQPSAPQKEVIAAEEDEDVIVTNKTRIICLTAVKNESHLRTLEECVQDTVMEHNKLASSSDNLVPISHCELCIVHSVPVSTESHMLQHPRRQLSPLVTSEFHVAYSGHYMAIKMLELVMAHLNLASTSVTGIPMKEEQNASSSANYDVELLHASEIHTEILQTAAAENLISKSKEGLYTDTIALRWCTPKSNTSDLQQCTSASRISPVDVNSRPSSCLTNFLLSGRAVMLEQPRKSGQRVLSHMLTSHGGEIYIHTLAGGRCVLEDPPSISEGCGGRVTDYRINDFGETMKECRMAPAPDAARGEETPMTRSKKQLERMTRFWPMTINESIIFNMMACWDRLFDIYRRQILTYKDGPHIEWHIDPLPSLIVKETMNDDDMLECKKAIYDVVAMESKNEALPISTAGSRGKGPKRDEQYRQMWGELEILVRAHATSSPNHAKVLECLLECRKPYDENRGRKGASPGGDKTTIKREPDPEVETTWKEYHRASSIKEESHMTEIKSPDSPPTKHPKLGLEHAVARFGGQKSLLALWSSKVRALHNSRHPEFAGRSDNVKGPVKLYPNLDTQVPSPKPAIKQQSNGIKKENRG